MSSEESRELFLGPEDAPFLKRMISKLEDELAVDVEDCPVYHELNNAYDELSDEGKIRIDIEGN